MCFVYLYMVESFRHIYHRYTWHVYQDIYKMYVCIYIFQRPKYILYKYTAKVPYFLQRKTLAGFSGCLPGCTQAAMYSKQDTSSLWFCRAESISLLASSRLTSSSLEWQASHRCGASAYGDAGALGPCPCVRILEGRLSTSWKRHVHLRVGGAGEFPMVPLCLLNLLPPPLTMVQTRWLLCVPLLLIQPRLQLPAQLGAHLPLLLWVPHRAGASRKTRGHPTG